MLEICKLRVWHKSTLLFFSRRFAALQLLRFTHWLSLVGPSKVQRSLGHATYFHALQAAKCTFSRPELAGTVLTCRGGACLDECRYATMKRT